MPSVAPEAPARPRKIDGAGKVGRGRKGPSGAQIRGDQEVIPTGLPLRPRFPDRYGSDFSGAPDPEAPSELYPYLLHE